MGPTAAVINRASLDESVIRAIELTQRGDFQNAEMGFREILRVTPQSAPAHHNLGVCLLDQGRPDEAEGYLVEALRLEPAYAHAHRTLGCLLYAKGAFNKAEEHLRQAISIQPDGSEAWNDLGAVLNRRKCFEEAKIILQHAVRLSPRSLDALNNLGISLMSLGDLPTARRCFERALKLRPNHDAALCNLGNVYKEQGKLAEALACYDLSLLFKPDSVGTHWNRSLALLQSGDFLTGWKEYEWRWQRQQTPLRHFTEPFWNGGPIEGCTILLHAEQGLGDSLQFIRYGVTLKTLGATVIFECPSPLLNILSDSPAIDGIIREGDELPTFQVHAPLMSLPRLCKTTLKTIPAPVPYVRISQSRVTKWNGRVKAVSKSGSYRIGIIWQGNPHHPWDRFRSIPLHEFDVLASVRGTQFFSLQTGPGYEQLAAFHCQERFQITDVFKTDVTQSVDMADIAAVMNTLDLIITPDTATAHLAGAMGKRVWVIIAAISDWRWLQNEAASPWYPTMRLFRQKKLRKWRPVFIEMRHELRALMERDRSRQTSDPCGTSG